MIYNQLRGSSNVCKMFNFHWYRCVLVSLVFSWLVSFGSDGALRARGSTNITSHFHDCRNQPRPRACLPLSHRFPSDLFCLNLRLYLESSCWVRASPCRARPVAGFALGSACRWPRPGGLGLVVGARALLESHWFTVRTTT